MKFDMIFYLNFQCHLKSVSEEQLHANTLLKFQTTMCFYSITTQAITHSTVFNDKNKDRVTAKDGLAEFLLLQFDSEC